MQIVRASIVFLALLCPISSYAQTGNFFEDLAKGLDSLAKSLEAISDPQKAGSASAQSGVEPTDPADAVPIKFKNSTQYAITAFKVAKPEDAYFGNNLVGSQLAPGSTFEIQRDKNICTLNFFVMFSNNMEKKINKVNVCNTALVDIDTANLARSRNAKMSSVASTLQSNLGPNGNMTVALGVVNANPGCSVGGNRFNIPKSGWNIDFDNNIIVKLRAKNPEKYGVWDAYGVTYANTWNSTKDSAPVPLSFLCAE